VQYKYDVDAVIHDPRSEVMWPEWSYAYESMSLYYEHSCSDTCRNIVMHTSVHACACEYVCVCAYVCVCVCVCVCV
jgi:hypothetical protein